jgi:hypothetical protein
MLTVIIFAAKAIANYPNGVYFAPCSRTSVGRYASDAWEFLISFGRESDIYKFNRIMIDGISGVHYLKDEYYP